MKISIQEVSDTLLKVIETKSSLTKIEAQLLAADYLEGELQGKKSHGLAAFISMIPKLGDKLEPLEILKETDAALFIDAHGRYGALVGREVGDLLIAKAKKQGVAMASIRQMKTWLRPGAIAQYIAASGLIGVVTNTGSVPMVAPPNGVEPVVGTNPIGIGVPTKGAPLVVDMATSERAWGEVRLALASGKPLPDNAFLDDTGKVTTDAKKAYSALPFGGYKGFSLALFIELLCGAFAQMPMGEGDKTGDYSTRKRGANVIVIDPDFTVGRDSFTSAVTSFADGIRNTRPAPGAQKVTLAGDRSTHAKEQNIKNGFVDVDSVTWTQILK